MRVIRQLAVPQDGDLSKFPDGQIQNETDTVQGTPVVREVYGDVLTNLYAILRDAGFEPNGNEDNELGGYQLLEALKQFANKTNDLNQVLTVSGTNITVAMDVDILPDDFVFTGILSDSLTAGETYNFNSSIPLTPTSNISASSFVIVVLNSSGSKIYNIGSVTAQNDVHIPFELPMSFNDTDTPYYFINGRTLTDEPKGYNTQSLIRTFASNSNINVIDAVVIKGHALYLGVDITTNDYKVYVASLSDLNDILSIISLSSTIVTNENPYMFTDGDFLYFSNSDIGTVNSSANDFSFSKWIFDSVLIEINSVSEFDVDVNFEKTTNYFIKNDIIYTFVEGNLYAYPLDGSPRNFIGFYNSTNGIVFSLNGGVYFSTGEFASKWNV